MECLVYACFKRCCGSKISALNIISFWITELPLGYLLGIHLGLGVAGVTWSIIAGETMLTLLAYILFRQGKWLKTEV